VKSFLNFFVDQLCKPKLTVHMVRAPKSKINEEKNPTRVRKILSVSRGVPGIRESARQLGVDHSHLSRVVRGERISHSLLRRYHQLKGVKA
jgi:transcriptional regulator with XRE-family HTH domain